MKSEKSKEIRLICLNLVVFMLTIGINRYFYVGVIDNPILYVVTPIIMMRVYNALNRKCDKEINKRVRTINYLLLVIYIVFFFTGLPNRTYAQTIDEIKQKRFKDEKIIIMEIPYKDKKMDSVIKRPALLVEEFYRVKIQTSDGTILNFYVNPQDGKWAEK